MHKIEADLISATIMSMYSIGYLLTALLWRQSISPTSGTAATIILSLAISFDTLFIFLIYLRFNFAWLSPVLLCHFVAGLATIVFASPVYSSIDLMLGWCVMIHYVHRSTGLAVISCISLVGIVLNNRAEVYQPPIVLLLAWTLACSVCSITWRQWLHEKRIDPTNPCSNNTLIPPTDSVDDNAIFNLDSAEQLVRELISESNCNAQLLTLHKLSVYLAGLHSSSRSRTNIVIQDEEIEGFVKRGFLNVPNYGTNSTPSSNSNDLLASLPTNFNNVYTESVRKKLENSIDWSFNVLDIQNDPLILVGYHVFNQSNLLTNFDLEKFIEFLNALQENYHANNPYHNRYHAADVLQACYSLTMHEHISPILTELDTLALYFSAMVHDVDHPGVNNNYLICVKSDLANLYNDRAVLESHHASTAFKLLSTHNFMDSVSEQKCKMFRQQSINLILATDFNAHFTAIDKFKQYNSANKDEQRSLVATMIIKLADLSNVARTNVVHVNWASRVMEEFFNQGDLERLSGIPVSPFMDRRTTQIPKCQSSFIQYLCKPMFIAFDTLFSIPEIMQNMENNMKYWQDEQKKCDSLSINTAANVLKAAQLFKLAKLY